MAGRTARAVARVIRWQGRRAGKCPADGVVALAQARSMLDRAKNDFSQHFVDSRQRPANFIRDSNLTDRSMVQKLKELIEAEDERIARAAPAMFKNVDLRGFDLTTLGTVRRGPHRPAVGGYRRRAASQGLEDEDEEQAAAAARLALPRPAALTALCSVLAMAGVEPQGHHGAAHRGDHRDALFCFLWWVRTRARWEPPRMVRHTARSTQRARIARPRLAAPSTSLHPSPSPHLQPPPSPSTSTLPHPTLTSTSTSPRPASSH